MAEATTPVAKKLLWLPRVPPEVARGLLVGCGFHDGTSDTTEVTPVVDADAVGGTVTLAGGSRPMSLRRFRDGEFVDMRPGAPLATVVAATRTPGEMQAEAEEMALRRAGFVPGRLPSAAARCAVLAVVEVDAAGRLPDARPQLEFHMAVKAGGDVDTARAALRVLDRVAACLGRGSAVPEDLAWQRAVLLRQAGRWQDAMDASEVLYTYGGWTPEARLYLATTRAASMLALALALAQVQVTPWLVEEAERALQTGWAVKPEDETLKELWRALDQLAGTGKEQAGPSRTR